MSKIDKTEIPMCMVYKPHYMALLRKVEILTKLRAKHFEEECYYCQEGKYCEKKVLGDEFESLRHE